MGLMNKIEYTIKHNSTINALYRHICSLFFRCAGCFIRTDEKLILFTGQAKKINGSPKAIYNEMVNRGIAEKYDCVWGVEDPKNSTLPGHPRFVKIDTLQYFKTALKAKYWICSVNIERGLHFKKKSQIYMNTWHGAAINVSGNGVKGRKDFDWRHIDFFCVCGKYDEVCFGRDMKLNPGAFLKCGYPRNDILNKITKEERTSVIEKLHLPAGKKYILYAPTWRDSEDGGGTFQLSLPINFQKWEEKLGNAYVILFRAHPNVTKLMKIRFNDFVRDFTDYPEVNDLMIAADILISDYSSILPDFAITEKPMICFGYDYEQYSKERGLYYDLEKEMPSGVLRTEDEVINYILQMEYDEECKKTRKFKQSHCEYEKGEATETCIRALFGEQA